MSEKRPAFTPENVSILAARTALVAEELQEWIDFLNGGPYKPPRVRYDISSDTLTWPDDLAWKSYAA